MKRKTLILAFAFSLIFKCFGQDTTLESANRRTAVRCLKIAERFLSQKDYQNAIEQAKIGLNYDENISDLWYIIAASKSNLQATRAEIIPLVMKSLTEGDWVDYNRDGARVLYADLLCETGEYDQAIAILNTAPLIYTCDAEIIRAKAYYRIKTEDSIQKAREKIVSARKIYPLDMRFPRLFFKFEYALLKENIFFDEQKQKDPLVQNIADAFIAKMPEYDNPDAELEIYACIFAEQSKQKRMLEAFSAHNLKHPLFAHAALKNGLFTQQEAWDYFCEFSDKELNLEMLEDILPLITDEITKQSVKEHLDCFSGNINIDTNFDCEYELFAKYIRGRPENFKWDSNNDGIFEWSVKCDFGNPEKIFITEGNVELTYGTYPAIIKAVYKTEKYKNGAVTFNLQDESLFWTPVEILPYELVKDLFNYDFYVPSPVLHKQHLNTQDLLYSCTNYQIVTEERNNAFITFSVLDGKPLMADYYENDNLYAHTIFEDGKPKIRSVDNDGDNIFETTETFGYDPENKNHIKIQEQYQIMTNIFGLPSFGSGFYVKMIQIDQNGDTIPDFSEEYLQDGGKISSWDFDADGEWNLRHKKYPQKNSSEPLIEESLFYKTNDGTLVTVTTYNSEPVQIKDGENIYTVTQGEYDFFYWVGTSGSLSDEIFIMNNFDHSLKQGISVILQREKNRFNVVKIGQNIFAELLQD